MDRIQQTFAQVGGPATPAVDGPSSDITPMPRHKPSHAAERAPDAQTAPVSSALFVSVIVPVYNDVEGLKKCLGALEDQTFPAGAYEVIVVDNGSTPPIAPLLSPYHHAVPQFEALPGSYAARNRGVAASRGEILAFTDADCTPAPSWIAEGVAALGANPDCGLIAGDIRVVPRNPASPTIVEFYELAYGFRQAFYVTEGFGATANLFTRRDVFDAVGPFDARLRSCGDREWGMRVSDAGYRLCYAEAPLVLHPARRTWGELITKTARVSGGMFELARLQGNGRGHSMAVALSELRPPLRQALRVLQGEGPPGWWPKLSVIAALILRRWVTAFEWLRLEAGASPRR